MWGIECFPAGKNGEVNERNTIQQTTVKKTARKEGLHLKTHEWNMTASIKTTSNAEAFTVFTTNDLR